MNSRATQTLLWTATLIAGAIWAQAHAADNGKSGEYAVKLAFIYNFTKFVNWPASAFADGNSPMMVCIIGDDPFPPDAEQEFRSRTSNGHPLELRKVKLGDNLNSCHVIFAPKAESRAATALATGVSNSSTLTMSEQEGFAKHGGVVEIFIEDDKLRFEVNITQAKARQLTVSSQLLALARNVRR